MIFVYISANYPAQRRVLNFYGMGDWGRIQKYDKETGRIYTEVLVNIECNDWDYFYSAWDIDTLKRMLQTQITHENYEMAEIITKHIGFKNFYSKQ